MVIEVLDLSNSCLSELLMERKNVHTGCFHKSCNSVHDVCFLMDSFRNALQEHKERYCEVLSLSVTHDVKCTHETKEWTSLSSGNVPMLFEEKQWENTSDVFSTKTHSKTTFLGDSETSMSIFVFAHVEESRVKEAVSTHEGRYNLLDHKFGWINDCCLRSANVKT